MASLVKANGMCLKSLLIYIPICLTFSIHISFYEACLFTVYPRIYASVTNIHRIYSAFVAHLVRYNGIRNETEYGRLKHLFFALIEAHSFNALFLPIIIRVKRKLSSQSLQQFIHIRVIAVILFCSVIFLTPNGS
jgi:hypothetical protein